MDALRDHYRRQQRGGGLDAGAVTGGGTEQSQVIAQFGGDRAVIGWVPVPAPDIEQQAESAPRALERVGERFTQHLGGWPGPQQSVGCVQNRHRHRHSRKRLLGVPSQAAGIENRQVKRGQHWHLHPDPQPPDAGIRINQVAGGQAENDEDGDVRNGGVHHRPAQRQAQRLKNRRTQQESDAGREPDRHLGRGEVEQQRQPQRIANLERGG